MNTKTSNLYALRYQYLSTVRATTTVFSSFDNDYDYNYKHTILLSTQIRLTTLLREVSSVQVEPTYDAQRVNTSCAAANTDGLYINTNTTTCPAGTNTKTKHSLLHV